VGGESETQEGGPPGNPGFSVSGSAKLEHTQYCTKLTQLEAGHERIDQQLNIRIDSHPRKNGLKIP
jgi:hypothetical protein